MNMKKEIEFQEFGKNVPYKVPDGFFDSITNTTLQKAKLREQNHKRNLTLWRTMAVAASLAALVTFGYLMTEHDPVNQPDIFVLEKHSQAQQPIVQQQKIDQQPTVKAPQKAIAAKVEEKIASKEDKTEVLVDVLADLSDEELLELDAMYKT
ncbi:MAG TPA: hypothetical protein DCL77_01340, partial [Prolixibacteraceae bacterium]|nr:hypothetical protein [Prolixibacteraceae bacterium]